MSVPSPEGRGRASLVRAGIFVPVLATLGLLPSIGVAQGFGSLLGRISSTVAGSNLANALVSITGTGLSVSSGEAGLYVIVGVPSGRHEITVELLGFQVGRDSIQLEPDEALVLDFRLEPDPVAIDGLLVSAEASRSGAVVIGREEIARRRASTVTQLLRGAVPGLTQTVTSGDVGAASRIRMRGNRSLEASPPLFFVDGVRIGSSHVAGPEGTGGILTFLDNINPRDIQRIEILRAAEATTFFGTDAVGGAILIFTRR